MWIAWGIALAVPIITAIGTAVAASIARRKVPEEAAHVLVSTAIDLVEPLRTRVQELERRVDDLEKEVFLERRERLWRELHAAALEEQLHAAGVMPVSLEEIRRLYPAPED